MKRTPVTLSVAAIVAAFGLALQSPIVGAAGEDSRADAQRGVPGIDVDIGSNASDRGLPGVEMNAGAQGDQDNLDSRTLGAGPDMDEPTVQLDRN